MIQLFKIDDDGFFIEGCILEKYPTIYVDDFEVPDWHYVNIIPTEGLYKPKWDDNKWIEGLTESELSEIQNIPIKYMELEKVRLESAQSTTELFEMIVSLMI